VLIVSATLASAATVGPGKKLIAAAKAGSTAGIRRLCRKGCEVEAEEGEPLRAAAARGHLEAVEFLIQHGARVNKANPEGHATPLIVAASAGKAEVVKVLLDDGANINHCGDDGTALAAAASEGRLEIVRLLIARGAAVNVSCGRVTPLALAIQSKREAVSSALEAVGGVTDFGLPFENELIVVPEGYAGAVGVIFDRGFGADVPREDGTRVYALDSNGVFCADALSQVGHREVSRSFAVMGRDGRRRSFSDVGMETREIVVGGDQSSRFLATRVWRRSESPDGSDAVRRIEELVRSGYCRKAPAERSPRRP